MGFLQGRRILVTGMLSNRSIAYGIAKACQREGAELAFTYQGEGVRERVADLAQRIRHRPVFAVRRGRRRADRRALRRARASTGTASTAWCTPSPSRRARR